MVIEAKIGASEGEDQLSQFEDRLEEHFSSAQVTRVFLTPEGRKPVSNTAVWKVMSYSELAGVLRRVAGIREKPGYHFLRYYLTGVLRDVCGLQVPITLDCKNPYAAVDYLHSVVGAE
jgi:hypothetical protein